jgi:hypothetical protein
MKKKRKTNPIIEKALEGVKDGEVLKGMGCKAERFFKKIIFGKYIAFALDENHDVYKICGKKMEVFKSNVKNIFSSDDDTFDENIFGIDLDGKLFKIYKVNSYPWTYTYIEINLRFNKIFVFPGVFFGNVNEGNVNDGNNENGKGGRNIMNEKTYICRYTKSTIQTKKFFPFHLKWIIQKQYIGHLLNFCMSYIFFGIDYNNTVCVSGDIPNYEGCRICHIKRHPQKTLTKLLRNYFEEEEVVDILRELWYKGNEDTITCSGKKIDVKFIYGYPILNTTAFAAASDRDGRVYFYGIDKFKFINTNTKCDDWAESPYFIDANPTLKAKTKKKQQNKLFNLLKDEKYCDLIFFLNKN